MSLYGSLVNTIPYQAIRGLLASTLNNPDLQWEETRKLQGGIDLGLIKNRLTLSVNYFRNRSNNTLTQVKLPATTGFGIIIDNFPALIQNNGWEFSSRSENIKSGQFSWTTNINLTIPRNKLISFPGIENSSSANTLIVGQPLTITKDYSFYGIDPQTGVALFRDVAGNTTTSPVDADMISILNSGENFFGGLQNSIGYKGISFDFLFQFTKQKAYNYLFIAQPGIFDGFTNAVLGNQPITVLNRWQKPGAITNFPRYSTRFISVYGDRSFEDASYVRLKNISLSYQLPQRICKRFRLRDSRFFLHGQNILTITSYEGLDPETQSFNTLPPLRVITVGAQITL
jgi:TonB-dependent starch-binding outer membrane protein SusC